MVVLGGLFRGVLVLVEVLGVVFGAGLGGDRFRRGVCPAADQRRRSSISKNRMPWRVRRSGKISTKLSRLPGPGQAVRPGRVPGMQYTENPFYYST